MRIADLQASTLTPIEQNPNLSGGDTCIRTTSTFTCFRSNSSGISLRKTGVYDPLPAFIICRTLLDKKKEFM